MSLLYDSFIIYTTLVVSYAINSLVGYVLDTNHVFEEHKIKNRTKDEYHIIYKKCLPRVLVNVGLWSLPYIMGFIYLNDYINGGYNQYQYNYKILNVTKFIWLYIASYLITDIVFFTGHWLMHTKNLYRYHKIHHEIKNPVAISALYMHPVDLYFSNLSPIGISALILNLNIPTIQILILIQIFFSVSIAHGGYKHISFNHNIHHTLIKYNYGLSGYKICMDTLCKTEYIEPLITITESPQTRNRRYIQLESTPDLKPDLKLDLKQNK